MTTRFEIAITNRAAAAIAAAAGRPGPAASTARAWIDSMTARAQLRSERRQRRTTARRFAAAVAGLLTTAVVALVGSPSSHAALTVISPGEEVDYINPGGRNQFCTIGYVYTGDDMHTYAITAGHCRADQAAGYARDKRNGLTGDFVRSVFEPPRTGGGDYALIDFHTNSLASPFIVDQRMPFMDGHPEPQIGETVCRLGVSSGQQCGQIAASQGQDQYLTTGMPPSIPGDSGGPVWTPTAHGFPQIIGIWLGEKTTAAGQEYGRFASLSSGLRALNAPGHLGQNSSSPE